MKKGLNMSFQDMLELDFPIPPKHSKCPSCGSQLQILADEDQFIFDIYLCCSSCSASSFVDGESSFFHLWRKPLYLPAAYLRERELKKCEGQVKEAYESMQESVQAKAEYSQLLALLTKEFPTFTWKWHEYEPGLVGTDGQMYAYVDHHSCSISTLSETRKMSSIYETPLQEAHQKIFQYLHMVLKQTAA